MVVGEVDLVGGLDKYTAVKIFLSPCIWHFCRGLEDFRIILGFFNKFFKFVL